MTKKSFEILLVLLALSAAVSCSTVPISGRSQMAFLPDSMINSMSLQQYNEFLQQHQLSSNQHQADMVKRVGLNIQRAVEQYFRQKNQSGELKNYRWEFNLVDDPQVNAWCMPGGKVVVYTGILPIAKDDKGLAVVMGHEIAHAIAKHGNERMSQGYMASFGQLVLSQLTKKESEETQKLLMTAYGAGATVGVLLPFSRKHESEADHLGLIFMAMAGYDPNEAVTFWQRMGKEGGPKPPEFMSTHPSDETRVKNLKKLIPEAMPYYQQQQSR